MLRGLQMNSPNNVPIPALSRQNDLGDFSIAIDSDNTSDLVDSPIAMDALWRIEMFGTLTARGLSTTGGASRARINGIQITAEPEPGSMALLVGMGEAQAVSLPCAVAASNVCPP